MKKVTVIKSVISRARLVFAILLIFTTLLIVGTVYAGKVTGQWNALIVKPINEKFQKLSDDLAKSLEVKPTTPKNQVKVTINNNVTKLISPTPTITPTQVEAPKPAKVCYRATVTHLDGSTSNLCYNQSDSQQLINLGYDLSSAKTFYQFHLDGAQKYQDMYDQTKSSIYLDAKATSEKSAQREKDKMGSITLQMQTIEKRGY